MARLGEPRVLVRLAAERLHEPHAAHRLLQHARDLAVVAAQPAVPLAQLSQHRLQCQREERRDDERDEGEAQRVAEQNHDRTDDLRHVLQRARHELGDQRLRLLGVGQHARDDLSRLRALEPAERQPLEVAEDAVAKVARHVLLQRRAELSGEPDEEILQRDDRDDRDHHRLHRSEPVGGIEEGADHPLVRARDPAGRRGGDQLLRAEQRVEKERKQREREDVERRCDDVRHDGADHPPGVRAKEMEKPAIHGQRFGVSSDTGRMHSSGVTPPCRNEPRYRLWYSRSFVG